MSPTTTLTPEHAAATAKRRRPGLLKLVLLAAAAHVLLILILSPSLFFKRGETLEETYALGEAALREGKHAEALQLFRKVMDAQPRPAPIFVKAAEQHRLADRMLRQASEASAPAGPPVPPAGSPFAKPPPHSEAQPTPSDFGAHQGTTRPTAPTPRPELDVPPELRRSK